MARAINFCSCGPAWKTDPKRLFLSALIKFSRCLLAATLWIGLIVLLVRTITPIVRAPVERNEQLHQTLKVLSERLTHAFRELNRLKKQNNALKMVIQSGLSKRRESINELVQRREKSRKDKASPQARKPGSKPVCNYTVHLSVEYEQVRRNTERAVSEMWSFLRAATQTIVVHLKNDEMGATQVRSLFTQSAEYTQYLLKNIQQLSKVDGFAKWRAGEAKRLSGVVGRRLELLQNPPNCESARTLVCELNQTCGLHCLLSRATECMAEAYHTRRTLILESDVWNENFQPLSMLCNDFVNENISATTDLWPGHHQVLRLRLRLDGQVPVSSAVPYDLATPLNRLRGDPLLWWRSQLFSYLMRPLPTVGRLYRTLAKRIQFKTPAVGVCLDDEGDLDDVMAAVEHHFLQLELTTVALKRRIFVSSSDAEMPNKIRKTFAHYEVLSALADANDSTAAKQRHLHKELLDVHFLSKCDFIVSAEAPELCQVAFSLMQYREDAYNKYMAVGAEAGVDHRRLLDHLVLVPHAPQSEREISLRVGDILSEVHNLANGYSRVIALTKYHRFSKYPDELSEESDMPMIPTEGEEHYEYPD